MSVRRHALRHRRHRVRRAGRHLTPFFESPLRQRAEQFANLTAYVDRMMPQYYPEFVWAPLEQAA